MDQGTSDALRFFAALGIGVIAVELFRGSAAANSSHPPGTAPAPGTTPAPTPPPGPAPLPDILPPSYYQLTSSKHDFLQLGSTWDLEKSRIRTALLTTITNLAAMQWNGGPVFTEEQIDTSNLTLHPGTTMQIILQVTQSATDAQRLAMANAVAARLSGQLGSINSSWSSVGVQLIHKG